MVSNKKKSTHQCPYCQASFKTRAAYLTHKNSKHANKGGSRGGSRGPPARSGYQPFMGADAQGRGRTSMSTVMSVDRNLLKGVVLSELGPSGAGSLYALRALHPMDETLAGGERIPDLTSADTAALEARAWTSISAPDPTSSWDLLAIILPFPDMPIWWVTKNTSATNWPAPSATFGGNYLEFPDFPLGEGAVLPIPTPSTVPRLAVYADSSRTVYSGATFKANMANLTNTGTFWGGQYLQESDLRTVTPTTGDPYERHVYSKLPSNPADLVARCAKTVMWQAEEGAYFPIRYAQPVHEYQANNDEATLQFVGIDLTDVPTGPYTPTKLGGITPVLEKVAVSKPHNMQVGIAIFKGLDKTTTMNIHLRRGLQVVPVAPGPWAGFIETAPMPDVTAITNVARIQNSLQLVYPERYNSLGALLPVIGKIAAGLASWGIPKVIEFFGRRKKAAGYDTTMPALD